MKYTLTSLLITVLLLIAAPAGLSAFESKSAGDFSDQFLISSDGSRDNLELLADDHDSVKAPLPQRLAGSDFQHQQQQTPNYELVAEFLPADLSAKHFVYIRTIPDVQPWYETTAYVPNRFLLSGWKTTDTALPLTYLDTRFS